MYEIAETVNAYHKSTTPPLRLAWAIWGWGAAFYLVGFFLRVAPAVMTAELMQTFNISATALGNLSAFYFYSYVAMQIPTGILADIWGPRRLLTTGAFIAGTGILMFALAPSFLWASFGRFLSGTVNGVINMGIMMGPTLLQPVVGWMLDRSWRGDLVDGIRTYNIAAYHAGFILMMVWAILSFVLLFFTRETYCRQQR